MYRAGSPADAALPWSRTSIKPWTAALTVVAAVAVAFPPVMMVAATGSLWPAGLGAGVILLLVESVAVPLLLATAGAMLVRGRRLLLGPQLAFALFPFATALVSAFVPLYSLTRHSAVGSRALSVFGSAESIILHGACASAAACVVLAVAMGGALATVDRARLDVLPRSPWTVFSAGATWFVLAFALRAANASAFGNAAFLAASLVVPLAATALAAVMTWCSGIFARTEDPKERRAAFAFVLIGAFASGAAALLVDRASSAAVALETLRVVRAGSEDPFAILLGLRTAQTAQTIALGLDIAGCAVVFGIAARAAWRAVKAADRRAELLRSRSILVAGSTVLGAGLLAVIVSLIGSASRNVAARNAEQAAIVPGDLELPTTRADLRTQFFLPSEAYALHVDGRVGRLVAREAVTEYPATLANVYADRRAPFSVLVTALHMSRLPWRFHLISRRETLLTGPNGREALGDLAAFLPRPEHATPVAFSFSWLPASTLVVRLDDAPVVRLEWQGRQRIVSLGGDEEAATRAAALDEIVSGSANAVTIRVVPRGSDTIGRILSVVQALGGRNVDGTREPIDVAIDAPTSSAPGSAGSASSPRYR